MSATECMSRILVSKFDVFIWGVVLGGLTVALAKMAETWFHNKLILDQKKLDIVLAEDLLKMKEKLDDRNS